MSNRKNVMCLCAATLIANAAALADCRYIPDEAGFEFSFTAYAAPDRAYVVSQNTFTSYTLASPSGELLGASISIDPSSLDTSADLNNGMGGHWDVGMAALRSLNVVNGLFNNFASPEEIHAEIEAIESDTLSLSVTMNAVTQSLPMSISESDGILHARGTLDILKDFKASSAFSALENLCIGWHRGKTWSDVDIRFQVPVKKKCS